MLGATRAAGKRGERTTCLPPEPENEYRRQAPKSTLGRDVRRSFDNQARTLGEVYTSMRNIRSAPKDQSSPRNKTEDWIPPQDRPFSVKFMYVDSSGDRAVVAWVGGSGRGGWHEKGIPQVKGRQDPPNG